MIEYENAVFCKPILSPVQCCILPKSFDSKKSRGTQKGKIESPYTICFFSVNFYALVEIGNVADPIPCNRQKQNQWPNFFEN